MSPFAFITASLRHHRRIHLAVALGVAVATAVLTGALLVGDSVSSSLRNLTIQRLGRIDSALVAGHLFRAQLADELASSKEFNRYFSDAQPALLIVGTLQAGTGPTIRRATNISVIGCRPEFWSLEQNSRALNLEKNQIAITESVARELNVQPGDSLLLRLPIASAIPADSPLGEKSETSVSRTLKIAAVVPSTGLARFSLMPSQHQPRNAFVPLATVQDLLDKPRSANAILVATSESQQASGARARRILNDALRPQLADYGARADSITSPTAYTQVASDQLVLPTPVVRAAEKIFGADKIQPVSTYLANTIATDAGAEKRSIPYSTVVGVDSIAGLGPLLDANGRPILLQDDEIALNQWAAEDLQAKIGDPITITFYEPESTHGELREHKPAPTFKLKAIVPLENADGRPTPAADPHLTPEMKGVTDQDSIRDWELPFELVETIRSEDEDYWDKYRTTPKAFVSLSTAQRLWPSRWGEVSLLRFPHNEQVALAADSTASSKSEELAAAVDPGALGMTFLPVKRLGLEAASGTTPFGGLFLGFSFFLIAAALMLIALLFQLGIEQRAAELGTLTALGWERSRIGRLLSREGLLVAVAGATLGIALGVLYAWLMILGLRTWWLAAISTPFLELHVGATSLIVGWIAGILLSWLTIRWSIRRMLRSSPARLLAGDTSGQPARYARRGAGNAIWTTVRVLLVLAIVALVTLGFRLQGESQAGVFFGSGAATLVFLLGEIRTRLRSAKPSATPSKTFSLPTLARLNATRNPGRSTLTIGLVAAASFLILAISAFRLETTDAGTGGFEYIATSDRPIHYDLNTPDGRFELGISDKASRELDGWQIYSLRVASGEDASCLNLYRPAQPRVLGVPTSLIQRGGFAWASAPGGFEDNPWNALADDLGRDAQGNVIVPVVIDASTAIYSLHLSGIGSKLTIRDAADQPVTLQVVGLLKNSILQGSLLVAEDHFLRLFPDTAGYRYFLLESPPQRTGGDIPAAPPRLANTSSAERPTSVPAVLESILANEGVDVVEAREQLAAFLAVQNTYLSTFQSLGALGLLLGTVGLAIVQLRSVLERRGELALMRAGGFSRSRLVRMVILENAILLVGGLAVGGVAAAVALIPQWAPRGANIPWLAMLILLASIAVVGVAAGWLATRSALRAPILPALRGD